MSDEAIVLAIEGLLGIAASNFPADTDIIISVAGGKNTASVRLPYYVLAGILAHAKNVPPGRDWKVGDERKQR